MKRILYGLGITGALIATAYSAVPRVQSYVQARLPGLYQMVDNVTSLFQDTKKGLCELGGVDDLSELERSTGDIIRDAIAGAGLLDEKIGIPSIREVTSPEAAEQQRQNIKASLEAAVDAGLFKE
ncbi:MAG: hypothetical protein JSW08_03390 [archaeon]|nr:MAG: hypothetical protein JSW08_03390 [archaeon]